MDATYKTAKYSMPLFFVCVKTNVCFSVVAEFIIQSETSEDIYEALSVVKTWNPNWNPKFYLLDYSDPEIAAVNKLFPATEVYLCEFQMCGRIMTMFNSGCLAHGYAPLR